MSVIDDINKRRTRQSVGEQPAAAPAAQPMGDQASARVSQGENGKLKGESPTELNPTAEQVAAAKMLVNPAAPQAAAVPQVSAPTVEPVTTYTDIAKRINPELDAEAKAKREKQLRTKKQVAAIGDAISALANMHYTGTSGVNAYDPSATLSGKAKENYDKFLADVKSYEDAHKAAMLRGAELNAAATEARRKEAKAEKRADDEAGYKKRKEDREVAESDARIAKDNALKDYYEAQANYYNSGGKKPGTSSRSSTGSKDSITLINDDGTETIYRKSDSVDYIHAAYTALPNEYKIPLRNKRGNIVTDDEGNPVYTDKLTLQQMQTAIARYNARKLKKSGTADEDDYSQYAVGGDDYSQFIVE